MSASSVAVQRSRREWFLIGHRAGFEACREAAAEIADAMGHHAAAMNIRNLEPDDGQEQERK